MKKNGLIGPIKRNKNGYRDFQEQDLKRIEFVKCMRKADLSIDVLRKYLQLYNEGEKTKEQRTKLLLEQKGLLEKKIKAMQEAAQRLDYKIKLYYEGKLDEFLEETNKEEDN